MDQIQQVEKGKVFINQQSCSDATGIPLAIIKLAKKQSAPGFMANNTIKWDLFEPYIISHRQELEDKVDESLAEWKRRKTKADGW